MSAIFKREFKAYFQTVIGWLFIAATLCIYGFYFYVYNLVYGKPTVSNTLSAISFIFLITVPILTMRILSEEQKNKTDQMIFTAPVSVGKIVAAKYLAMAAVYSICIAVISITPLILSAFGKVSFAESYVAILGFWLYGLSCIAIGMFISSLTESQVIAAVLSFAMLFVGFMMGNICSLISQSGNMVTKVLKCYDLTTRLDNFSAGMLDAGGIIYYLTLILLFLFLAVQSIQKRRWSMSSKKIKLGVFSTGMVVFGIALAVIVNLVVASLPTTATQIDVTKNKLYSLTSDTNKMLKKLDTDINIYVLSSESGSDATLKKMLDRYKDGSSHIKVEYKDPAKYPNFYQQYTNDTTITQNSLIVVSNKRNKLVNFNKVYQGSYDSSYNYTTTGYDGEGQVTSAIQFVTSDNMPVVYQIQGHNETELTGDFADVITKSNVTLQSLTLLKSDKIPDDAAAIIINGPQADFSKDDVAKVNAYLQAGGKAFITTTDTKAETPNFYSILSGYGVTVAKGIVLEGDKDHYTQYPQFLLPEVASNELTSSLPTTNGLVLVPVAQGMTYPKDEASTETAGTSSTETTSKDITYTPLLTTTDKSYSKVDVNSTNLEKESGDIGGPFAVGLDVKKTASNKKTTELIVYSCSGMFKDEVNQAVAGNNSALFSGAMNGLVDTSSNTTTVIPVKKYEAESLVVSTKVVIFGAALGVAVIPLALVISGIVIWVKRRKR